MASIRKGRVRSAKSVADTIPAKFLRSCIKYENGR